MGEGEFGESSVDIASGLTIDDVLIISCDRYSPWDGTNAAGPDHIWSDLPLVTGVPLLVYCERRPALQPAAYRFGKVDLVVAELSITDRVTVFREAGRDLLRALRQDRRLALGLNAQHVARFLWRAIRGRKLSPYLCRYQVARLVISRELNIRKPSIALFHGEFGPWGLAVTEACRIAGVTPIGVQHGPMSRSSPVYQSVDRLGSRVAEGLLCVSDSEMEKWRELPLPVRTLGSRRMRWSVSSGVDRESDSSSALGISTDERVLVFPPSAGTGSFKAAISAHSTMMICVKPHPLHTEGWDMPNVQLVEGEIHQLAAQFRVIVTGSPGVQLTLALLGIPYIRVRSSDTDDWPDLSGAVIFDSLDAALDGIAEATSPASLLAHHVDSSMIPPDVGPEKLLEVIRSITS